jgi:hypothetical protein
MPVINRGIEGLPLHEARPAPASIFPDEHIIVAQPSPSEVNPSFLGPVLFMKSAIVDLTEGTVTLPLYPGKLASGENVWSILTDISDERLASLHGVNFSPKMVYGAGANQAIRTGNIVDGVFHFDCGKVDFSGKHTVTPGTASPFPPLKAVPGAVGDDDYSPLVCFSGVDAVFNMPMIAFDVSESKLQKMSDTRKVDHRLVHDRVVRINPAEGTVTLSMTLGYTFGKPLFYISTDVNDAETAALESATYAPALKNIPFSLEDAHPGETAERLYAIVNGPTGSNHPFRQGLNSALSDAGNHGPLNVFGGVPTINLDYSPLWRMFPVQWEESAIAKGYRTKLTNAFDIENAGERKIVSSYIDGGPLRASGIIINCPVVYRIN